MGNRLSIHGNSDWLWFFCRLFGGGISNLYVWSGSYRLQRKSNRMQSLQE